jgi:hypothetical protein
LELFLVDEKVVTLMINSTFYDMFGEYNYFLREVFPELKEICRNHNIDLGYRDVAFSVPEDSIDGGIVLQDLRCIDSDRTFFICFRGQKLGWRPTHEDIDWFTVDEYPEIINFIGNVSITELAIMHALIPFERCVDGKLTSLSPVKHSLFYFRNPSYLDNLSEEQLLFYANKSNGEFKETQDLEIAKAKDLIHEMKHEFEKSHNEGPSITIRHYDGIWDGNADMLDVLEEYSDAYSLIKNEPLDYFLNIHRHYACTDTKGCLCDFRCEDRSLKEVMIEDIIGNLKLEFPENFE